MLSLLLSQITLDLLWQLSLVIRMIAIESKGIYGHYLAYTTSGLKKLDAVTLFAGIYKWIICFRRAGKLR